MWYWGLNSGSGSCWIWALQLSCLSSQCILYTELDHPQISGYGILKTIQMSESLNRALGLIRIHVGFSMMTHKSCEIEQVSWPVLFFFSLLCKMKIIQLWKLHHWVAVEIKLKAYTQLHVLVGWLTMYMHLPSDLNLILRKHMAK